jgi:DNA-binding transcriptional MocR family regulator
MPDDKKRKLVELLMRHDVPLIEDDVYGELHFGNQRPVPAKTFDSKGIVMLCSSFSKCLAPGYRIGWAVPGRYTKVVARHKLSTTLSVSVPSQLALADYLAKGGYDKHLRQLRQTLCDGQHALMQAVMRHFPVGTRATRPAGGYFLWLELPATVNTLELHRQALALGISIAPGPMFSAQRAHANCLRLNYGHPWDARIDAAVDTLGKLVRCAAGCA